MLVVEIPFWKSHYNQLLYSALMYTQQQQLPFRVQRNPTLPNNTAILRANDRMALLDYDDQTNLCALPQGTDLYFKRSLLPHDRAKGILPLQFQVNFAHAPWQLMYHMQRALWWDPRSRVELVRALDVGGWLTHDAHQSKRWSAFEKAALRPPHPTGRVLYLTRLWDPDRHADPAEKERRAALNRFRINTCRLLRLHVPQSTVGLYPDPLALRMAPELVVDRRVTHKAQYLQLLHAADIGIADDGLGDTPGWKIGEYVMAGKAIISTPIRTVVDHFEPGIHYARLQHRNDSDGVVEAVVQLQHEQHYCTMQAHNRNWYAQHLHPVAYMQRILTCMSADI